MATSDDRPSPYDCADCGAKNATHIMSIRKIVCAACYEKQPSKCDFCNVYITKAWEYPTSPFYLPGGQGTIKNPIVNSITAWLACWHCSELIEEKNWKQLVVESIAIIAQRRLLNRQQERRLFETIYSTFVAFDKHRNGARKLWKKGE